MPVSLTDFTRPFPTSSPKCFDRNPVKPLDRILTPPNPQKAESMTPDQLTRLTLLLSMAALTASENKELAFLKSIASAEELASATPESDDDGDDDDEDGHGDDKDGDEDEDDPETDPKTGKPSVMDHARAMTASKASLVRRNGELSTKIGRLTSQNQQLTKTIGENATTIAALQTDLANLKGELAQAKGKLTTLSAKVSEELAGLGVTDRDLPAPGNSDKSAGYSSEEEVNAAIEAAKSFEEKAAILEAWENRKSE